MAVCAVLIFVYALVKKLLVEIRVLSALDQRAGKCRILAECLELELCTPLFLYIALFRETSSGKHAVVDRIGYSLCWMVRRYANFKCGATPIITTGNINAKARPFSIAYTYMVESIGSMISPCLKTNVW